MIAEEKPDWTFTIPVVNDTGRPVRFERVVTSCSCSQAALDESQLPPGGSTRLVVRANLRGRSGPQTFGLTLVEDGGISWEYQAKAEVVERVKILHNGTKDFRLPNTEPGSRLTGTVTIELAASSPGQLPSLEELVEESGAAKVEQATEPAHQVGAMWVQRIVATYAAEAPSAAGPYSYMWRLSTRAGESRDTRRFSISGAVAGLIQVSPEYLLLTPPAGGGTATHKLVIRSLSGESFKIEGISGAEDGLSCRFEPTGQAAPVWVVTAEAVARANEPTRAGALRIRTDLPRHPVIVVPYAISPARGQHPEK